MENRQRNETTRITTLRSRKWTAGALAMLLGASLVLAACGDGGGSAEEPAVSTPVATLEAPAAEDTEAEAEATEAEGEDEAATETEVITDTIVETEVSTDTEVITETEVTTDIVETDVITQVEVMTDTEEATETDVMTETEEVGGETTTEVTTETEGTGEATPEASEEITDTEAMTETGAADTAAGAAAGAAAGTAMMGVSGAEEGVYVRASTLLDYDFENLNGDVSGDLEDLLIDLSTGNVLFTSIEYGGVLDLGDKDIVVPLSAFTVGPDGELVLNIDEAELESYPDVGNDWPDLTDPAWDDDVNTYWNEAGIDIGEGATEASPGVGWASDIVGHNVADLGVGAGSILDILVNLGTGRASYIIVDYGRGLDTDPVVIPVRALEVTDWNTDFAYSADFTPDLLEGAPRFDMEAYPEGTTLDPTFGESIESTWNDLGFSNDLNNDGDVD